MSTQLNPTLHRGGHSLSLTGTIKPSGRILALTVPLYDRETLQSYVSRLTRRNGLEYTQDLCRFFEMRWISLVNGDPASIDALSDLCGVDAKRLGKFAVRLDSHHIYRVNGQVLSSEIAKRYDQRLCPACIAADLSNGKHRAYGRAEWQLSSFRVCPVHKLNLITLPRAAYPRSPYDFAGRLFDHKASYDPKSLHEAKDGACLEIENYIIQRLEGAVPNRWIDQLDLDVALKFLRATGAVLEHGSDARLSRLSDDELAICEEVAFDAAGRSAADLYDLLEEIAVRSETGRRNFHKDFGAISAWLSRVDHRSPRLAVLLDTLSAFAFAHYPIPVDKAVFGRKRTARKIHRLFSAAREFSVDSPRLKRFLRANDLPQGSIGKGMVFPIDRYGSEIQRFAECLSAKEAAARLGIGYDAFKRLHRSKKLRPQFELPGIAHCYHPSDILELLNQTKRHAKTVSGIPSNYEDLLALCIRTKCPIEELQALVASGKIQSLCSDASDRGFRSIFADPEEVWEALPFDPWTGITKTELKALLRINDSTVKLLVEEGFLEMKTIKRSRHRRAIGMVGIGSLKQFVQSYVTLGLIAADEGVQGQAIYAKLRGLDLIPFTQSPKYSLIYHRSDIADCGFRVRSGNQQFEAMMTRLDNELRTTSRPQLLTQPNLSGERR